MRISFGFVPFHSNGSNRSNGSNLSNGLGRCMKQTESFQKSNLSNGLGRCYSFNLFNDFGRCMQRPDCPFLIAITGQTSPTKPQYPTD